MDFLTYPILFLNFVDNKEKEQNCCNTREFGILNHVEHRALQWPHSVLRLGLGLRFICPPRWRRGDLGLGIWNF